ncbi:hypothetical protein GCM10009798_13110 [Nocardioides panacihumi]|uniref:SIR2-like domain-containing protein n=1 Tax=Nocardioides panacihumi TaxID=400774 RepID=A0ABN2QNH3_9ACTN
MTAPDLDGAIATQLRSLVDRGDISILLGAGASMAVGLPDWETLAVDILRGSGVIDSPDVALAFLRGQDPMLAVEAARGVLSNEEWHDLLAAALYSGSDAPFPSALHFAVAQLAAQRDAGTTRLFTLNFDTLLEEAVRLAFDEIGRPQHLFTRASATPRGSADSLEVHHLHGVISPIAGSGHSDVILGLSDFVGLAERSWQYGELQQAVQRGPLILAGTSYRDPDMRDWIYDLTRSNRDAHVATLLARASMGLSRAQFQHVRDALVAQWRAVGVEPILLQDHADAAQVIRELTFVNMPGYAPPRERAARVWQSLCSRFEALQAEHALALEEDRQELKRILGSDTNVTLWVADGEGTLVRWAAPDRIYREATLLKRIPANHDSPWIAGQCLAIDDVIAKEPVEDPGETRRWRSVVAVPIAVTIPGGPQFTTAVISTATTSPLKDHDLDAWYELLGVRANLWSQRLESLPPA